MEYLKPSYIRGLTILGGEPFEPANQAALVPLVRTVKERYANKSIWCYTGYLFDDAILKKMMPEHPETAELLSYIDILVDGPFIEEEKDISLKFRGSRNQRIIQVQESLKTGQIVLWDETQDFYPRNTV